MAYLRKGQYNDVGTYSLHTVANEFSFGLKDLSLDGELDLNEFVIN